VFFVVLLAVIAVAGLAVFSFQTLHPVQSNATITTENFTYTGSVHNGLPQGEGVITWKNGDTFASSFDAGVPTGTATFTSHEGWKFSGPTTDGKLNGTVFSTSQDGKTSEETFLNGALTGAH
jgi:hypothetical protein